MQTKANKNKFEKLPSSCTYKELVKFVINQIETKLDCPISVTPIINPIILPSGITVDYEIAKTLNGKKNDSELIQNKFFMDIQKLYVEFKSKCEDVKQFEAQKNINIKNFQTDDYEFDQIFSIQDEIN